MLLRPLFAFCLALVNERADLRRLIECGVDGIITDYPDRLREVMRERGLALPPTVSH
jgi:glycerophosphoryl diester phosphodiesterase